MSKKSMHMGILPQFECTIVITVQRLPAQLSYPLQVWNGARQGLDYVFSSIVISFVKILMSFVVMAAGCTAIAGPSSSWELLRGTTVADLGRTCWSAGIVAFL